ncbi:SRPBCC family protein [Kangiella sp. TOML190]|uniref:SRPBCC family protein n=1 Tax=Kangiella sp. TOML190 TaxID=2931351 RepID=UPI00203C1832|nr:SRPBCC family protein [Kangiella sp. TOML190]
MAILRRLLISLAIFIGLLFVISFFLPKTAQVERSIVINSSQETLFNYLNTTKNFNQWSPWFEMDPSATYEFSGPEVGVGGALTWDGEKTGKGTQEVIESNPYSDIKLKLVFDGQPPATASYHLESAAKGTKITWRFHTGLNGPIEKYLGLMMDSFVGDMYAKGLNNLKAKVEALPEPVAAVKEEVMEVVTPEIPKGPHIVTVEPNAIIYMANRSEMDGDKISQALAESYGKLVAFMAEKQLNFAGAPLAITTGGSPEEGFWAFEAALPVDYAVEVDEGSEIQFKRTYAGKAVKLVHIGPYMEMTESYKQLAQYVAENNLLPNGNMWEQYISDPANTAEEELITRLYFPIQ